MTLPCLSRMGAEFFLPRLSPRSRCSKKCRSGRQFEQKRTWAVSQEQGSQHHLDYSLQFVVACAARSPDCHSVIRLRILLPTGLDAGGRKQRGACRQMVARGSTPRILAIPKIVSLQFHFQPLFSVESNWALSCTAGVMAARMERMHYGRSEETVCLGLI